MTKASFSIARACSAVVEGLRTGVAAPPSGQSERIHQRIRHGAEEEAINGTAAVLRSIGIKIVVVENGG